MRRIISLLVVSVFIFSGCTSVRTYTYERDRVDQKIAGNQGYFQGKAPSVDESKRNKTRTMVGIDVESSFLPIKSEERIVSTEYKIRKQAVSKDVPKKDAQEVVTVEKKAVTVSKEKAKPVKAVVEKETVVFVKGEKTDDTPIVLEKEEDYEYIK
ncbi:MAG: hypothetical protein PHQ52_05930 [Candidatus Omnitrophica bacterium]|nr:hypothetical protein [Candidatus Omnitrophota bacterium]